MSLRSSLAIGPKLVLVSILSLAILCSLASCIWLNRDPVAVLSASSTAGEVPLEVAFDAYQSHDPDGDRVSCEWDFGDGQIAQGMAVQHGFGSPGQYTVRLLVTDSHGNSDSATITISVTQASSVISGRQQFDADDGIQYSSSTGLSIVIQPQGFDETLMLVVAEDPTPQQPADRAIQIHCVYSIEVETAQSSPAGDTPRNASLPALSGIRLTIDIPPGVDPNSAVIMKWRSVGWELAGTESCLGGILSADKTTIHVDLQHFSTYAIASSSSRFEAGDVVRVINRSTGLRIREWNDAADTVATVLRMVPEGWVLEIVDAPDQPRLAKIGGNEYVWWKVREIGHEPEPVEGWAAEGNGSGNPDELTWWLEKIDGYRRVPPSHPESLSMTDWETAAERAIEWAMDPERNSLSDDDPDDDDWGGWCSMFVARAYGQTTAGANADNLAGKIDKNGQFFSTADTNPNAVAGTLGNPPRGALIFFEPSSANRGHGHVAIYLGAGRMVNAYIDAVDERDVMKYLLPGSPILYKGWAYPPWRCAIRSAPLRPGTAGMDGPPEVVDTLTPTLEWEGMPGADRYGIYLSTSVDGGWEQWDTKVSVEVVGESYKIRSDDLEWGCEYRWRMKAHFPVDPVSSEKWGCLSERMYFNTASQAVVPTSLTISGLSQVGEGDTEPYTCTATFSDGSSRVVTSESTWSLSVSSSYATISNGQLTAKTLSSDKSCTITARFEDNGVAKSATKTITLKDDPPIVVPTSLTISGLSQVGEGDTEPYTCTATFSDGSSRVVTSESTWSLSVSSSYATISNGQLTAKTLSSDKSCTITARFEDNGVAKSATKTITLKDDPPIVVPTSLTISGQSQVGEGDTEPYTCTATFSDGSSRVVTSESTWSLSVSSSYATISNGQLTAKTLSSDKSCTITARFEDNGVAKSATKTITLKDDPPIVVPTSLTISGQSQVGEGDTEPYTCTATFSDGSSRVVTSESTWSLSVSSSYATISNGQLTAKTLSSDKSCTITARFEDNGVAKSATKTITLKDDPPIVVPTSLTISGQSQVGEGDTEPYTCTATFSDGSSRVVTSESTWSLSVSSSYATISNGQLTAKTLSSDKSCTITARFEDNGVAKSATKTITLKDDPPIVVPTSLTISGQSQVGEGDTEPYTCTATFSDGSSRVVTSESTWSLSVSSSYATISNGQLTAKTLSSDKSCTITARFEDNGVAKSATKTITLKDDPPIVVPTSLTISGQSQVGEGDTEPYTCTATFSDGSSRVVTSESTWSLSVSSSYATISNGQLTAKTLSSDKSCTITARFEDNGVAKSATKTITLKDDPPIVVPTSLTISGLSQVGEGDTEPYTCTATFSDGSSRVVTSESTWSLSVSSSYATISNGQLTAKTLSSDKSCTITARFEDNGVAKSATKTITLKNELSTVNGQLLNPQVSPNPATAGDSVSFRVTVENTGTVSHTFVAGLSVWKVGTDISTSIIDTNDPVTLAPGQQQTLTLRTYSFSSSQIGDWNYQFGLWKDYAGGTFMQKLPSPAGVLTIRRFLPGDIVEVENTGSAGLLVRATSCGTAIDVKYDGTRGTVIEGPIYCSGYDRWKIRWSDGVLGWSAEDWLRRI